METKKISSPFTGRDDGIKYPGQKFDSFDDLTITEAYEKEIVKKTGDAEDDFIVEKKLTVYKKYSRDKFVNDAADDVGILNVLKKVAISGRDLTEENPFAASGGYVDMTQFPNSLEAAADLVAKAKEVWNNMPVDLKKNMDYEAFIKNVTPGQVYAYYQEQAAKEAAAKEAANNQEGGNE